MRFCVVALLAVWVAGPAPAAEPLRLVTDDWPPYEYLDTQSGEVTGFSTELIRRVLHRLDHPVAPIQIYPWARAEREVQVGNAAGIYTLTITEPRLEYLYFPEEPLHSDTGALFVRRAQPPTPPVREVADLGRIGVAIVRGYSYSPEVLAVLAGSERVTEVTDEAQLFGLLARGRVDGVLTYRHVGNAVLRRMGLDGEILALREPVLFRRSYYVGFNKRSVTAEFVARFSDQLRAFKGSSEYPPLERKYFGAPELVQ